MPCTSWNELVDSKSVGKGGRGIYTLFSAQSGGKRDSHLFAWDTFLQYLPNVVCTLLALESDFAQLGIPFDLGVLEQSESEEDKWWGLRERDRERGHDSVTRVNPSGAK